MSLSEKLHNGENVYGTCIVSNSPIWPKAVQGAGLDFVFIDTEHLPIDRTELTMMCQVYGTMGLSPIVRIPYPDAHLAGMARDAGAVGVLAPYIEKVAEVEQLVGAVKLRPLKGQRLAQVLAGKEILEPELTAYLNTYNQNSLCLINIESRVALDQLDVLLDVPGLDAVIVGPHDLSINMGFPEHYEHPDFEQAVAAIIKKARNKNVAAGIHFPSDPKQQVRWIRKGANLVLHSSDMFLFAQKLKEDIGNIKQTVGEATNNAQDSTDFAI